MDDELHKIVHDLNNIRTVNKVCKALLREITERNLKQNIAVEDLSKRLDAFLLESSFKKN